MIIDSFSHIYPQEYVQGLKSLASNISITIESKSGYSVLANKNSGDFVGGFFKEDTGFIDPEVRLEHMKKYGIDTQILTIGMPGVNLSHHREVSDKNLLSLSRIANDSLSSLSERFAEKFYGVAEVPILTKDNFGQALDEIDRCIKDLGLRGLQLYTLSAGLPLEDEMLTQVYKKAVKYDVPILLHPTNLPGDGYNSYQREFKMNIIFGWPFETSIAMSRLAFSGAFDRFPDLKILTHHLGGMIPYFAGRYMLHFQKPFEGSITVNKKPAEEYIKRMFHDTAVYGNISALLGGYSFFGSGHILFGTDYPFGPDEGERFLKVTVESIKEMHLPHDDEEKVFFKNAQNLFKIR